MGGTWSRRRGSTPAAVRRIALGAWRENAPASLVASFEAGPGRG
ncbi:MAG TPA: hypothetical protein VK698_00275 [Kofleriaceae bacterium]|nr:hypothetical protein [Kofleriaceae bacterium]